MDKKKILIIDDELEMLQVLKLRLEADNYIAFTASNGDEGLEKAKNEKPDLILLDIMMPKKDGFTFVKDLKADDNLRNTPIIVLTGKTEMKDLFAIEGIKDYILKPFDDVQLLKKIKQLLPA